MKNKKYKMLVMDMDDTLLTDELTINIENIKAIKKAYKEGIKIVFCSGRGNISMKKYIDMVDILTDNECIISFNGAKISDVNGKDIFVEPIHKDEIEKLVDIGRKYNESLQLYKDDEILIEKRTNKTKEYERLSGTKINLISDLKETKISIKALYNGIDIQKLKIIKKEIENKFGNKLNVFFSKPYFLECVNINANKGIAVKRYAKMLGIKQDEIIAVGDSYNDLFMIEYAGLGIAMKNANEDIKEKANYVTSVDNNGPAIKEIIDKFIL